MLLPPVRRIDSGRAGRARRAGVTLVELLVVLVILGVAAGVVVPVVRPATATVEREDGVQVAQRLAAQRGEALRVSSAGGRWLIVRDADPDDTVARGTLPDSSAVALAVLPSGVCLPVAMDAAPGAWDPVGCRRVDREAATP
ncbi:MAG: prepilin-type N-terminal cleavage/methylation domain-containing protein [Gemmatimonadaceae bacterium]|jgi:prepilin-type N-terminal cleavage/methylation domain-containing protein|nr:prepilin-type N-terminal cleavage/methylation domain-containing protein [Gemmatimonadaceae bacterium]